MQLLPARLVRTKSNRLVLRFDCALCGGVHTHTVTEKEQAVGRAERASHCEQRPGGGYTLAFDPSLIATDISRADKNRTRRRTHDAIRQGKLKRRPCEVCGYPHAVAHHVDYADHLRVAWLCPNHHYEVHAGLLVLPEPS